MKILALILGLLFIESVYSQDKILVESSDFRLHSERVTIDSTKAMHFVYIVPTSNFGHMLFDLTNIWVEKGYGYKYKKSMYCFGASAIVYSEPQSGGGLFPGISNSESNGFGTSAEYKRVFFGPFYSSIQISYEYIETKRPEKYLDEFNHEVTTHYKVFRNEISLIPRVGLVFLKRNKLSCDLNIGTGIRLIWSTNSGKKYPGSNLQEEGLTEKVFDSGHKFAQRLSVQMRFGYAF